MDVVLNSEIHDICENCFWQDDPIYRERPDSLDEANSPLTLKEAQMNFLILGACDENGLGETRSAKEYGDRDPKWKLL
ncbi:CPCC family cysteine-rich protein [Guptibacillus spartinae]|uniref:CPCC family cysteine-rich protein n=1 Tax=Guptibacillus spartinae TaxID=3025679 RepID=UPI003B5A9C3F